MDLTLNRRILEGITQLLIDFNQSEDIASEEDGLFIVKSANSALEDSSHVKNPRSLWKTLWFEGEISCLFSDANLGKSIYAVQIGASIAKTDKVLYFDFELSEKQFQLRYTNDLTGSLYRFPDNLFRVEINCNKLDPVSFEENVIDEILQVSQKRNAKILIIDNLTYLCSAMEKAEAAGTLMKELISLKKLYGLSILILAHTPKRPLWEALNQNHLQGSKRLYNMFDSCFAIGQSAQSEDLRYIKELKVRWGRKNYGENNVIVARIEKTDSFLHFEDVGTANEREHLRDSCEPMRDEIAKSIIKLKEEGLSFRKIADQLNLKKSFVNNVYNEYKNK